MTTLNHLLLPSEHRIMQILIQGKTNKAIAQVLNLTEGSVETSLHRIYNKLEVDNRVMATVAYLQLTVMQTARES